MPAGQFIFVVDCNTDTVGQNDVILDMSPGKATFKGAYVIIILHNLYFK